MCKCRLWILLIPNFMVLVPLTWIYLNYYKVGNKNSLNCLQTCLDLKVGFNYYKGSWVVVAPSSLRYKCSYPTSSSVLDMKVGEDLPCSGKEPVTRTHDPYGDQSSL